VNAARVLIADDQARARATVRFALDDDPSFQVCGEAADADGAVEAARELRPDVCVLDINMPGGGIAAAGRISALLPDTAIVMLTVSRQDADLFDALRAGASGYLLKDIQQDRLGPALQQVMRGEASLPGTLVTRLVEEFRDREARRVPLQEQGAARLTGREWDVLELMRAGLTTNEMAERLFVSPTTVRTHISAVLRKLRVEDRDAAVRLVTQS
jgi:DNA-binding NarL/FixJ family response regulator